MDCPNREEIIRTFRANYISSNYYYRSLTLPSPRVIAAPQHVNFCLLL